MMKKSSLVWHYLVIIGVLLLYFAVRLFNLDALPLFIDESNVIEWSIEVRQGSPIGFGYHSRYLLAWLLAIFDPIQAAWWIPRVVMLLFMMPSAAALVTIARRLSDTATAVLALLLVILTPMLHFHERLILADTALTGMLTVYVLSLLWLFDNSHFRYKTSIFAGFIFALSLLTKVSAILMLPLAIVGVVILPKQWSIGERIKALISHYGTILILWMPLQFLLWWRNIDYFGRATQGSASGGLLNIDRILENTTFILEGYTAYFGSYLLIIILLSIIGLLIFRLRYALFFLSFIGGYSGALILFGGAPLYYRYWLISLPIMLLIVAMIPLYFAEYLRRYFNNQHTRLLASAIILLLWLALGIPFIYRAAFNPTNLPLPRLDRMQYIEVDSAGTQLPELAKWLNETQQLPIVGAFPQCYTLNLYTQAEIDCLNVISDNDRIQRINNHLKQYNQPFLLIIEEPGYVLSRDIVQIPLTPLNSFTRPGNRITTVIYRIDL